MDQKKKFRLIEFVYKLVMVYYLLHIKINCKLLITPAGIIQKGKMYDFDDPAELIPGCTNLYDLFKYVIFRPFLY